MAAIKNDKISTLITKADNTINTCSENTCRYCPGKNANPTGTMGYCPLTSQIGLEAYTFLETPENIDMKFKYMSGRFVHTVKDISFDLYTGSVKKKEMYETLRNLKHNLIAIKAHHNLGIPDAEIGEIPFIETSQYPSKIEELEYGADEIEEGNVPALRALKSFGLIF